LLTPQAASSSDKKAKQQNEKVAIDMEILTKLIQLFHVDAVLALYQPQQKADDFEDIKKLITGLCNCASYFAIPELADLAGKTLLELHKPVHIERWSKSTMKAFWIISAAANSALAELLIKVLTTNCKVSLNVLIHVEFRGNSKCIKSKKSLTCWKKFSFGEMTS